MSARALLALAAAAALAACGDASAAAARVRIPRGAGFGQATDSLVAHGVVSNRLWFRFLARITRTDRALKPGIYDVPAGVGPQDVLRLLREGRTVQVKVTIPEGITLYEVADIAARRFGFPADSVVAAATDSSLVRSAGLEGPTFEGYLRPETYQLDADISPRQFVRFLGQQFAEAWDSTWDARSAQVGLTQREVVALASIVEGEARVDEERPVIAAVYWNRLKLHMPLQADPTVQYAIQLATGERKTRLYEKDYLTQSIYNTYLHPGLPPGPVSSPGQKSIEATLYPADVPYLFFVASEAGDGRHRFSRTYREHLRTIAKLRRASR